LSVYRGVADPAWQIWSVNATTGDAHPVTSGTVDYYQWSLSHSRAGDLATIALSFRTSIWVVDSSSATVRRISSFEGEGRDGVSWVGERIVTTNARSISIHSEAGKQPKTDVRYYSLGQIVRCGPSQLVSFVISDAYSIKVGYLDLDSGRLVPFSDEENNVPSCSEDGSIAVYQHCDQKTECYLVSRRLPSGPEHRITASGPVLLPFPVVSPDGKLVLVKQRLDPKRPQEWAAIIPVEGGPPRPISMPFSADSVGVNIQWNLRYLRWSPDSKSILFPVNQNGVDNIWSYAIAGGRARQITHFDSDGILAFDVDTKGRLVVIRGAMVRQAVLIRHAR